MFADDTVLIYSHDKETILNDVVNNDLAKYQCRLYCSKLKISLEMANSIKYLGIIIDSKNWFMHIE